MARGRTEQNRTEVDLRADQQRSSQDILVPIVTLLLTSNNMIWRRSKAAQSRERAVGVAVGQTTIPTKPAALHHYPRWQHTTVCTVLRNGPDLHAHAHAQQPTVAWCV